MLFRFYKENNHTVLEIFGIKLKFYTLKRFNNKILLLKNGTTKRIKSVKGLKLKFKGSNNTIVFNENIPKFTRSKIFCQDNATVTFGKNSEFTELIIDAIGNKNKCFIGDNFSNKKHCFISFAREKGLTCSIGNNCLFATDIIIRTSDFHTIRDLKTNEIINFGKDITIGNHVWIAQNVTVLKGVSIADNSVIGACSVVTKNCDIPNSVYAGSPVRLIKSGIAWEHECPQKQK